MDEPGQNDAWAAALRRATETIRELREQAANQQPVGGPIAVVGVGLRLAAGIDDLDGYWAALLEGRSLISDMPRHRAWPFADEWEFLPSSGSFIDDALDFDPDFFGLTPRAAQAMDPQHRLLLEVSWEALASAGIRGRDEAGKSVSTFVGITGRQDYADWGRDHMDPHWALGNGHYLAAGRIAYHFGFSGAAVAFDSACSSSLVAIHHAVGALRRGESEVALAGGVNLVLAPGSTEVIAQTGALAPDGLCKTFDARANGYVRGEGCAMVVLKRLADAERDHDPVLGIIHGTAVNQDGGSSGFTAPNADAQRQVIEAALADAGCEPAEIGLVEAHGTGTALGDPIEVSAIVAALGSRNGGKGLHVGSAKASIGHLEAASGVIGLIKALLCIRERTVPPVAHFRTLNPRIDLAGSDIRISGQAASWDLGDSGPLAGVSSFGLIGTNAHAIVGPAPESAAPPRAEIPRPDWNRTPCVPAFLGSSSGSRK
ncbi:polyketide synthase [Nocardia sp. NPDC057668]|uniref:beta-ketoacyl [acyl carrier protein] synthase domain-containing protein n=1 Tax=Nocardia sp. NPDC057668 TaxID=3346202 RepID=UPI003671749D